MHSVEGFVEWFRYSSSAQRKQSMLAASTQQKRKPSEHHKMISEYSHGL